MEEKKYKRSDITGRRFDHIVAIYPTKEREKGSVVWHCRCDCGNERNYSYNSLMYCKIKSCGCIKKAHEKRLNTYLTHVEGTSLDAIRSKKVPTDNTTGFKGVYFVKGKYMAKIVFQKHQYYLGKFDTAEEAAKVRQEAENELFDGFAEYYGQWEASAETDPVWAKNHPIHIHVDKTKDSFRVFIHPKVSEMPLFETKGAQDTVLVS